MPLCALPHRHNALTILKLMLGFSNKGVTKGRQHELGSDRR